MPSYLLNSAVSGQYVLYTGQAIPAGWSLLDHEPVAGVDYTRHVGRTLYAIRADLLALTAAQKANVWAAFKAGTPPLWATDTGANAAAIGLFQMLGDVAAFSAADALEAKVRVVAAYVQDNPNWLVNPSFDTTVNVPGMAPG